MSKRQITLTVPKHFQLPPIYLEVQEEQIALALTLGAEAVAFVNKQAMTAVQTDVQEEAIKEATREFERSSTTLQTKLKRAEEAARASALRVEAMEQEASSLRAQIHKELSATFETLLKAKQQQIEQATDVANRAIESVGRKVEGLQHSMTKTFASSKEKGTLGEMIMEEFLKKAFDCSVEVISKEAQTADIRMTRALAAYFWEVKNYSRMVSKEEVEKFKRDLRLHPDVCGGVLVSLRQGIVGHNKGGDVDLEFLEDGRFILYLGNFMSHEDPVFFLQTLRPFFECIEAMAKPVKDDSEAVRALQMKATLITNLLRNHKESVTKHKNSLVGHKRRMDTMFAEFQGYVLEADAQLQTILRVAMGDDMESASALNEVNATLDPKVFKKPCIADFAEERVREFVKWFLVTAEPMEGSTLEVKDLIEKGKAQFSDKFVRGLREEVFHDAAWGKGSRTLAGFRFR
jgi:F0F1-type ATP synthase membrane subunit b/b'